jgi:hypothetical protein
MEIAEVLILGMGYTEARRFFETLYLPLPNPMTLFSNSQQTGMPVLK